MELITNPDSQPRKHPMKKDMARFGNQTSGLPVFGLMILGFQVLVDIGSHCIDGGNSTERCQSTIRHVVLDLGCTQSIVSRTAIERFKKHAWCYGITTEFCRCDKSCVCQLRDKPARKVASFTFQQIHHVQPKLMCLRPGICPFCFPYLRSKKVGMLLNWIHEETKLHFQLLVCFRLQLSTPQWDILCWT